MTDKPFGADSTWKELNQLNGISFLLPESLLPYEVQDS